MVLTHFLRRAVYQQPRLARLANSCQHSAMLTMTPVHAFNDNYIWVGVSRAHGACFAVDPGDADPLLRFLDTHELTLAAILVTHHHWDHVGGLGALTSACHVPVFGPGTIAGVTAPVGDGDRIALPGIDVEFDVLAVPGHTLDHLAYVGGNALFCGDTLFSAGCGRLFEGSAAQMFDSLNRLAKLPEGTMVYCAHEYTEANLRFAMEVEPESAALRNYASRVQRQRRAGEPSLPSSLADECACNPFLRCHVAAVQAAASRQAGTPLSSPQDVFAALRAWKDRF